MSIAEHDILFEDNHIIAVQKKAGQLAQGDETGDNSLGELIKIFLKEKYQKPGNVYLATLHRLDRPVQGIMLFAKTSKAAERLSKDFREGKIKKTYWAILSEKPKKNAGMVSSFLLKDAKTNLVKSYSTQLENSKNAITEYALLDEQKGQYLVELKPITGRSHQLRVHCAQNLLCPILGDVKYGSKHKTNNRSLYLLAKEIAFTHPITKEHLKLSAKTPNFGYWIDFVK